jgi:hypothetical protein
MMYHSPSNILSTINPYLLYHSQDFLCSKVIDNTPDQEEEEYQASNKKANIIIADTDYDWFDPNELFGDDDDEDEEDEIPAPGESKAQL